MRWRPLCQKRDSDHWVGDLTDGPSVGRLLDAGAGGSAARPERVELLARTHRGYAHLMELLASYLDRVQQVAHEHDMTVSELLSSDADHTDTTWAVEAALMSPDEYCVFRAAILEIEQAGR